MDSIDDVIRRGMRYQPKEEETKMNKLTEVQEIQRQIEALQARHALLIMEGRDDAMAQIKVMMSDYSISASDLGLVLKPPPRPRPKRAPKYRDPESGATWTGQGAPPKWLEGKDRDAFLIVPNGAA